MSDAPSILVVYGRKHYKLQEMIEENEDIGVSKRLPSTAVPEGMQRGVSKILCAHPDAIVKVTAEGASLADLAYALLEEGTLTQVQWSRLVELDQPYWTGEELEPYDFVPGSMLDVAMALSRSPNRDKHVRTYGLEFCMGVAGYAPYSGVQLVMPDGKQDLPQEYKHLEPLIDTGEVEPVYVRYENDKIN